MSPETLMKIEELRKKRDEFNKQAQTLKEKAVEIQKEIDTIFIESYGGQNWTGKTIKYTNYHNESVYYIAVTSVKRHSKGLIINGDIIEIGIDPSVDPDFYSFHSDDSILVHLNDIPCVEIFKDDKTVVTKIKDYIDSIK